MRTVALKLLNFYQRFLTVLGFGSCRYYPTCSEYAKWQFEKNSLFKAFFSTFFRILRCNQLFEGGIDYPVVKIDKKFKKSYICKVNQNSIIVKFWFVRKDEENFYLIKSF